jgi:hypothetical protein
MMTTTTPSDHDHDHDQDYDDEHAVDDGQDDEALRRAPNSGREGGSPLPCRRFENHDR